MDKFSLLISIVLIISCQKQKEENTNTTSREKIPINNNWKFFKYNSTAEADTLIYDIRPEVKNADDTKEADSKPTEAENISETKFILKPWILPTGNNFIKDSTKRHQKPQGNPGEAFPFVQNSFDDSSWETVTLPHDWGITGPFLEGWDAEVGGGMGRLPSHGVAWYRKTLEIPESDKGKSIFLDIDGIMSYAMVWLNGKLVGGWPYGYNSWRLDLTNYILTGKQNQLAIRVDNPPNSARWYPGGGIYRNIWLVKTNPVHVAQWGTFITTSNVSNEAANVNLKIKVDNDSKKKTTTAISIEILDSNGNLAAKKTVSGIEVTPNSSNEIEQTLTIQNPKLWGPPPTQEPNLYLAKVKILEGGVEIDSYSTSFGIRTLEFNPNKGLFVNGEHIKIKGVNQHHDLGALGAEFNVRAAERQLEILKELGCNAIRLAHNPPAPELLELTDEMGFLVINEIFDVWERKKTPLDFHLIFPEWYEQDTRAFVRRDRNHTSIIMWSYGNEVGEQYTDTEGAKISKMLNDIVHEEDPTRPTTASMNFAKPPMPFPETMDVISLNYQGEGIRDAPAYSHLKGITTSPLYDSFHESLPNKMIISSETASALSTRGTYIFPVFDGISAPISEGSGGNEETGYVSAYELYTSNFGASADKVFASQDKHPFVAGEFVWSGWDYLGEPTPYYLSRSSYCGIIDLAGFKKDRYYLYQSRWRPDLPMVHILPHWNWPDRIGKVTPVHVFTSGDEVELFLNGKSQGRKKKGVYEYRLRWDNITYEPGELKAIAYKNGKEWAQAEVKTTGKPYKLALEVDRNQVTANGYDLAFVTVKVLDENGLLVPTANNEITFKVEGSGTLKATDNGNPTDMTAFPSKQRKAFNGLALGIITSTKKTGTIIVQVESEGLIGDSIELISK